MQRFTTQFFGLAFALAIPAIPIGVDALPAGPATFCSTYSNSPHCQNAVVECSMCHTEAPAHNSFGSDIAAALPDGDFSAALPIALATVANMDSDGDGLTNVDEIDAGTFPGLFDVSAECPTDIAYDTSYVFRRVALDFCGYSPTFEEMESLGNMSPAQQRDAAHTMLDGCLESDYWRGKDGAIWEIANAKIRPIGALRQRGDFESDYALWAYTQLDDHDSRDALVGNYFVTFDETDNSYTQANELASQTVAVDRRAGLITSQWFLLYFTMFTAVPRNSAAQAYRSYLGLDIARQQGLMPIPNEPIDYDEKGVKAPECANCHSTLDPLSYPFAYYCGFPDETYCDDRPSTFADRWPNMVNLPEQGFILGQPVDDLLEWAQVGANSNEFAQARVMDYWRRFFQRGPLDTERPQFNALATALSTTHNYSINKMLHDLIDTEAYGVR